MEESDRYTGCIERYLARYPEERGRLGPLSAFLRSVPAERAADRRFAPGHLTASGLVVSRAGHVLLTFHRGMGRWLQPGGHIEPMDGSLFDAALREVEEETGIRVEALQPLCAGTASGREEPGAVPFDIDLHTVGARPERGEGAHRHYDVRFAFRYTGDEDAVRHAPHESEGLRWFALEALCGMGDLARVAVKLIRAIDPKPGIGAR